MFFQYLGLFTQKGKQTLAPGNFTINFTHIEEGINLSDKGH